MGYSLLIIIAKAVQPQSNLQEKAQKWRLNVKKLNRCRQVSQKELIFIYFSSVEKLQAS